ncbi:MAG: prepilin peptidase, partial [Acidimicrobiia bacterium]|nr:prepilin peptidase [Acidimicrobiia bacterium]
MLADRMAGRLAGGRQERHVCGWNNVCSIERPAVAVAVPVFALALAPIVVAIAWIDETWRALGVSATFIAISRAAIVDVRQRRLPDVLTVPGALVSIATVVPVAAAEGTAIGVDVATSAALGAAAFAGPLLVLHLVSPAGMGFGDVKAGVALGTAIGLIDTASSLVGLFVGSL